MIEIAIARGLSKMFAMVKSENQPMISVFEQFEFKRVFNPDPGEIELVRYLKDKS
jgi:L-amino acid N-acyltransferase YncA